MDYTTRLAIRALVRGLAESRAIGNGPINEVIRGLLDAADMQRDRGFLDDADALLALASDIGADARVSDAPFRPLQAG